MEKKKIVIKIPESGSLGILAAGHKGVLAWRKVRDAANAKKNATQENAE